MNSICSQIAAILKDKNANKFVVTTCVHVIDILFQKHPNVVYGVFFPALFSPLLTITQQPYYGSFSLEPTSQSHFPIPSEQITECVRAAARLLLVGSLLQKVVDSLSIVMPALFHLFVFSQTAK